MSKRAIEELDSESESFGTAFDQLSEVINPCNFNKVQCVKKKSPEKMKSPVKKKKKKRPVTLDRARRKFGRCLAYDDAERLQEKLLSMNRELEYNPFILMLIFNEYYSKDCLMRWLRYSVDTFPCLVDQWKKLCADMMRPDPEHFYLFSKVFSQIEDDFDSIRSDEDQGHSDCDGSEDCWDCRRDEEKKWSYSFSDWEVLEFFQIACAANNPTCIQLLLKRRWRDVLSKTSRSDPTEERFLRVYVPPQSMRYIMNNAQVLAGQKRDLHLDKIRTLHKDRIDAIYYEGIVAKIEDVRLYVRALRETKSVSVFAANRIFFAYVLQSFDQIADIKWEDDWRKINDIAKVYATVAVQMEYAKQPPTFEEVRPTLERVVFT